MYQLRTDAYVTYELRTDAYVALDNTSDEVKEGNEDNPPGHMYYRTISLAETYREKDIWFGLMSMEYLLSASSTLTLAFKTKVEYVYTAPFMLPLFNLNPWLKYRAINFVGKQHIVRTIQNIAYGRSWKFKRNAIKEVEDLFVEMLMSKIASSQQKAFFAERREELTKFIVQTHAAATANELVKASNTQNLFTWTNSLRMSPVATIKNVVEHAFQNSLHGITGLAQWELNQGCYVVAQRARDILPLSSFFPGGILGKIMQNISRAFLVYFHPSLLIYKGVVSLLLALLCQLDFPKLVNSVLSRVFRAKRRLGRSIRSLWRKYIGMRHDVAGDIILEGITRGNGVVMITLLFQLHGVDVDGLTRKGDKVEGAMVAGQGAWAFSDGLFVGVKDFAQLFSSLFARYLSVTTNTLLFCKDKDTVSTDTQEDLDFFYNGPNPGDLSANDRLLDWCSKNVRYIAKLETKSLSMIKNFLSYMVKTLRQEFGAFEDFIANVMSILYELAFGALESDMASTTKDNYGRPLFKEEIETLLRRQQQVSPLTKKTEMARELFRKPWMLKAVRNLAHGYFKAAAALALLDHLRSTQSRYNEVEREKSLFRGYQWLLSAAKQIRSALTIIFGRFLNSQAVITRSRNLKTRMRVYEFITQCQNPDDPDHESACGTYVTTSIDHVKFVAKSLLVLNVGVGGDPRDLILSSILGESSSFDPTAVFADWHDWMVHRGLSTSRHADFLTIADDVDSKEKVDRFLQVLSLSLQERLRFVRYEVEEDLTLQLFDLNGRAALFRPVSSTATSKLLKNLKLELLNAPAVFKVTKLNKGELEFAQAAGSHLQGYLIYADERPELTPMQQDPLALRELIVSQLTSMNRIDSTAGKELLVSQLVGPRGRLGAELVATLLMALHRRVKSFQEHSLVTLINFVTPKMFMDGLSILRDSVQFAEEGVALEQGLYSFPLSFDTLKDIFFTSLNTMVARMHALDFSDSLSVFVVGILHQAYQKVQKHRTGRTKILERFQQALLQVVDAVEANEFEAAFPECSFLARANSESVDVLALKCAIYRFLKLRTLDITKATEDCMNATRVTLYTDAVVEYLDGIRGETSWKQFLNFDGLRESASKYAETAGAYSFEELQDQMSGGIPAKGDLLGGIRDLMNPPTELRTRPESTEGTMQIIRTLISGMNHLGVKARNRVKNALKRLQRKVKTLLSHRKIPKHLRLYNVVSGGQFFGSLEHAERKAFGETGKLPSDFISTSDLAAFGKLLVSLERTGLFLENPAAMSSIISEMRSIPLITPESEDLYQKIKEKISAMKENDLRTAVGYIATYNFAQGAMGLNVALAMLALKGVKFATQQITHLEKIGILKVLEPEVLQFILRSLDLPLIFKHMKDIPEAEALTLLRFRKPRNPDKFKGKRERNLMLGRGTFRRSKTDTSQLISGSFGKEATLRVGRVCQRAAAHGPRGSISFGYRATKKTLPLAESVEVVAALDRLSSIGILRGLAAEFQLKDEETSCVALFESIQTSLKVDFEQAFKMWSREPDTYDKRVIASCAVFFVLKELLQSGQKETTVNVLLENLYFDGIPVVKYIEFVASTRSDEGDRLKQLNVANPAVAAVYAVVGGNFDALWTGYSPETGHLYFQSRSVGRLADLPVYDLFLQAVKSLVESAGPHPEFFMLELESYYFEEWLRFLEPARVAEYVENFRNSKGGRAIDKLALKNLSGVYIHYDVGDYYLSLRQRSVVPVADVVKSAAAALLYQSARTLSTYGTAMMMLDMSKEVREVKIACYAQSLDEYKEYTRKNREAQEMWKIDCAHQHLIDRGSLGYSAAALTIEDKDTMLDALDKELKLRGEALYNALITSEVDIEKLKKQVWTFISLPHISLRSGARLKENIRFADQFIKSVRERVSWEMFVDDLSKRRANKSLCRHPDTNKRYIYSYVERPYLFNPFQLALDMLMFVKTSKQVC